MTLYGDTALWKFRIRNRATCMPQGYTMRREYVDVDGIVEWGKNITDLVKKIVWTPPPNIVIKPGFLNSSRDWKNKLEEAIVAKYILGLLRPKEEKENYKAPSGLWSAAETFITNLAIALSNNPDGQAIVQQSIEPAQYSLLQDMKSGRIRGPAHVYGRHAGRSSESSDDD